MLYTPASRRACWCVRVRVCAARCARATRRRCSRTRRSTSSRRARRARGVVVVDAPLLFEKKLQSRFDATLLVACRPAEQARRVARRDGLAPAEVRRRLAAQWPLARKRALADAAIENDSTPAALRAQVRAWHAGLTLLHGGTPNGNADQDS